jgi:hypothetical protein
MLRVVTYFLFLVALSPACWAQTIVTPTASISAPKGLTQIINRLPHAAPVANAAANVPIPPNNGIAYNGGPIMDDANGVNVYYIWYGDWSKDQLAQKVLVHFITHIGGTEYFNINTTYYSHELSPNGTKVVKDRVINAVHYMGSTNDNYSQGANLSDYQVYLTIANAITSGALPADPNGVYFLLTSGDVDEQSGFGAGACGWHDDAADLGFPSVNGLDLKISWVGNAEARYAYSCIWNYQTTMSGSLGADGMASVIAHELDESVTDPNLTSWFNPGYVENGDLCAWTFGSAYHSGTASDPYPPNMKFKEVPYLIQEDWVNAHGGYCALSWDE